MKVLFISLLAIGLAHADSTTIASLKDGNFFCKIQNPFQGARLNSEYLVTKSRTVPTMGLSYEKTEKINLIGFEAQINTILGDSDISIEPVEEFDLSVYRNSTRFSLMKFNTLEAAILRNMIFEICKK